MLTKATLALFGLPEDAMPCRCQNCDWRGDYEEGKDAPDLHERIGVGEPYMDKECPECGALLALLSRDDLLEAEVAKIPVPAGKTRFRVVQNRDAFVHFHGYVDAEDAEEALGMAMSDDLLGAAPSRSGWIGSADEGANVSTYDSREIGVDSLDGETLIEPKED